jgi:hypothetical protein
MNVTSLTHFLKEKQSLEVLNANFTNPMKRADAKLLIELPKEQDWILAE